MCPSRNTGPPRRHTFANSQHGTAYGNSPQRLLSFSDSGLLEALLPQEPFQSFTLGSSLLTLAIPLIDEKLIALLAAAFKAAHCVAANVVTTPIVQAALIYVWGSRTKRKSKVILKAEDK